MAEPKKTYGGVEKDGQGLVHDLRVSCQNGANLDSEVGTYNVT
jgi:hypothetical protein